MPVKCIADEIGTQRETQNQDTFKHDSKMMLKMPQQWTKPVKKIVRMKNKVEDGSMEGITVAILKNDCSNKDN